MNFINQIKNNAGVPVPPKLKVNGLQNPEDIKKQLYDVIAIFDSLKATSGKKDKEAIIKANEKNELFVNMIKFLCNDMIVTGLSTKKINKEVNIEITSLIPLNINDIIEYLTNNNTGRDEDIRFVQMFIELYSEHELFLKEFFSKTYKCGVTSKTLNKVIKNAVPEFGVLLAESYYVVKKMKDGTKKKVTILDLNGILFIVTIKLDGMRIVAIKRKNKVEFRSRTGQLIEGLVEIEKDFLNSDIPEGVYDGELLAIGEFAESKDCYKETMKRARINGTKTKLKMVCFDYIEKEEDFLNGLCTKKCIERKDKLFEILHNTHGINSLEDATRKYTFLDYAMPIYIGEDPSELKDLFEAAVTFGEEGLMINIADAPYKTKRTKNLLKYKEFYNADLRVLGIYEGTGANKDKLGGIYVDYKGFTDKVGSGFTQEERELYYNNPDEIVGKIVDIQYFEETTNQENDDISMRFATFKGIRQDKTEPSYEI